MNVNNESPFKAADNKNDMTIVPFLIDLQLNLKTDDKYNKLQFTIIRHFWIKGENYLS